MLSRIHIAYMLCIIIYFTGYSGKCIPLNHSDSEPNKINSQIDSIKIYNSLGINNILEGDFITAKKFLLKSLHLLNIYNPDNYESFVFIYIRLGVINSSMWNFKDAIELYNKAEKICQLYIKDKNEDIGVIYYSKGRIFGIFYLLLDF